MTMKLGTKRRNGFYGTSAFLKTILHKGPWPERKGELHPRVKINESIARSIQGIDVIPRALAKKIARILGLHWSYIYQIKRGHRWGHLL